MKKPTDITINAWVKLVKAHGKAFSTVENAFKEAGFPALEWYDVLLELERIGDQGIRPFELQAKLLLPQYGMSRLVNRLDKAGYLKRVSSDDDGRGQLLFITPDGKQIRKRMWCVYFSAIEQAVGSRISQHEAKQLVKLLAKLSN